MLLNEQEKEESEKAKHQAEEIAKKKAESESQGKIEANFYVDEDKSINNQIIHEK